MRICSLDPMAPNYYSNKPALFAVRIIDRAGVLTEEAGAYSTRTGRSERYSYDYGSGTIYHAIPLKDSPWYF